VRGSLPDAVTGTVTVRHPPETTHVSEPLCVRTVNTILYCDRWEETVAFYEQGLGLEVSFANDWFREFRLGDQARLSVADPRRASIPSAHGAGLTVCLQVDDADVAHAALCARGLDPEPVRRHGFGARVFYLRDPEGHRVEVWSQP
jgi:catechol 2,3-dioxygenase-like lactoylglutathione lyase family enzyme